LNSSAAIWNVLPDPAEPKLSLPGCALASAISSLTFLAGNALLTTSTCCDVPIVPTDAKSLAVSKGNGEQRRIHGQRHVVDCQRIAVRFGLGQLIHADIAGRARAVVGHHRLASCRPQASVISRPAMSTLPPGATARSGGSGDWETPGIRAGGGAGNRCGERGGHGGDDNAGTLPDGRRECSWVVSWRARRARARSNAVWLEVARPVYP
jgi:hypothetical protein